jgi:dolichyl-phosphate-mannose--protein O-mannosyl transferase
MMSNLRNCLPGAASTRAGRATRWAGLITAAVVVASVIPLYLNHDESTGSTGSAESSMSPSFLELLAAPVFLFVAVFLIAFVVTGRLRDD